MPHTTVTIAVFNHLSLVCLKKNKKPFQNIEKAFYNVQEILFVCYSKFTLNTPSVI